MNHFIRGNFIADLQLCDDIIEFHKISDNKVKGIIYNNGSRVDTDIKDSTDCHLTGILLDKYVTQLSKITEDYFNTFPHAGNGGPLCITESVNVQHYSPYQGFKAWHNERCNLGLAARHLVFMTYLNDVTDAGETEFLYQEMKVRPEKGLTLIWPTDWTHTHRGVPSPTQEKYIVTGWINFVEKVDPSENKEQ